MNLPIDTCENGECAFAIRGEYDKRVYATNLGLGGGHFPATSVCVVYQHGEPCDYECGTFKWRKALQDEGGADALFFKRKDKQC